MEQTIDVRALRKSLEWSQHQLAEYLGVNRSAVSRLEHGRKPHGSAKKLLSQLAQQIPVSDREAAE